jgi:phosphoglucosamine mutase
VLAIMEGRPLSDRPDHAPAPQVLNVPVAARQDVETVPALVDAIERGTATLGERGRILVRYSGTEPLLRIMVEGGREAEITPSRAIAAAARSGLGASEAVVGK